MSPEFKQSNPEIVPPIIFNEDADVQAYPSVDAVIRDVEVVDILNEAYEFHDATGRVLEARVHKGKVSLIPTSRMEADSETLRGYIIGILRLHGVPEEGLSALRFGDLARLLLEKGKR
jgi:hypothetical protein